jgi:hypothetical protein
VLPGGVLSSGVVPTAFRAPRDVVRAPFGPQSPLVSQHLGGVALNDASQGLEAKVWTATYDGAQILVSAPSVAPTLVKAQANVLALSLMFDQNMQPACAYELSSGAPQLYWYDAILPGYATLTLPVGSFDVLCALDDTRPFQSPASDMLVTYQRAGTLYYRQQRDRFLTEYALKSGLPTGRLVQFGMNLNWRMQWQFERTL